MNKEETIKRFSELVFAINTHRKTCSKDEVIVIELTPSFVQVFNDILELLTKENETPYCDGCPQSHICYGVDVDRCLQYKARRKEAEKNE